MNMDEGVQEETCLSVYPWFEVLFVGSRVHVSNCLNLPKRDIFKVKQQNPCENQIGWEVSWDSWFIHSSSHICRLDGVLGLQLVSWFRGKSSFEGHKKLTTVDGRNPSPVAVGSWSVYHIIYQVLYIPGGAEFVPSPVLMGHEILAGWCEPPPKPIAHLHHLEWLKYWLVDEIFI